MAIECKWQLPSLEVTYSVGDLANVVTIVHWGLIVTEDARYSACRLYGSCGLSIPTSEGFTPYENLTEEEVISWVTTALGGEQVVQQMKDNLIAEFEAQETPKSGSILPPWSHAYVSSVYALEPGVQ